MGERKRGAINHHEKNTIQWFNLKPNFNLDFYRTMIVTDVVHSAISSPTSVASLIPVLIFNYSLFGVRKMLKAIQRIYRAVHSLKKIMKQ